MPTNVEIPELGDSVREAVLIKWLKADGQAVAKDEALCELETDKANVELPSPSAGVLRTTATEGMTVKIHEVVARIDEAGAATPTPPAKPAAPPAAAASNGAPTTAPKPPAGGGDLSPAVLRMVTESSVNPADVAATGPGGRITKEDVLNHLAAGASAADKAAAAPVAPTPAVVAPKPPAKPAETFTSDGAGSRRTPMSKLRVAIAKRLVEAQHTAAILTTFNEVDLTEVMALRAKFKETFEKAHGVGLGFMSFFAKAVCAGLKEFPRVNGSIDGADMVLHDYVHLGVAVSTERGLVVPVLRNVQNMGFAKIESEIKRVAVAARDGKVGPAEMSGATFTVTNGGVFGSLLSTPILTPPQSGILGMHTIQRRPVAVGPKLDQIEIRPMMYVALSYDHRLVDGKESVSFLVRVKQLLEDPSRLMLEV